MRDTELKRMRDSALYRVFVRGLEEGRFRTLREAAEYCRRQPAPEFFISAREASLHIGKIISGVSLINLNDWSRRKVWDLYGMYTTWLLEHPGTVLTRERILEELVCLPAPHFYLGVEMALKILKREGKKRRKLWE